MAKLRLLPIVVVALCTGLAWAQDCERPDTGQQASPVSPERPPSEGAEGPLPAAGSPLGDALMSDLLRGWEAGPIDGGALPPFDSPDGAGEVHGSAIGGSSPPLFNPNPEGADPSQAQNSTDKDPSWEETWETTRQRVKAELGRWQKLPWKWWSRVKDPQKMYDWAKEKVESWVETTSSWVDSILPGSDD